MGGSSRPEVLALLNRNRPGRTPCFSGLINVTSAGLDTLGLKLSEVHCEPVRMAQAAATTYRLFGFESAVLPLNLCVEAAALGARVDYGEKGQFMDWPRVVEALANSAQTFAPAAPSDLARAESVQAVTEAIGLLKQDVGGEIAVGAMVPGPFTLASLVIRLEPLLKETRTAPGAVERVLDALTEVVAQVALAYRAAGADFVTVHEMGGSPGFIGPPAFKRFVLPRLQRLMAALPPPRVLSVCGNTTASIMALAEAGADAISVDQLNDLAQSRQALGAGPLLFGNLDPVATLLDGDPAAVRRAVAQAQAAGVDAIWPGCDLWPEAPRANLHAMVEAAKERGSEG